MGAVAMKTPNPSRPKKMAARRWPLDARAAESKTGQSLSSLDMARALYFKRDLQTRVRGGRHADLHSLLLVFVDQSRRATHIGNVRHWRRSAIIPAHSGLYQVPRGSPSGQDEPVSAAWAKV